MVAVVVARVMMMMMMMMLMMKMMMMMMMISILYSSYARVWFSVLKHRVNAGKLIRDVVHWPQKGFCLQNPAAIAGRLQAIGRSPLWCFFRKMIMIMMIMASKGFSLVRESMVSAVDDDLWHINTYMGYSIHTFMILVSTSHITIPSEAKDVNFKAQNGWTALTLAVFHGRQDCVEALIKILGLFTSSFLAMQFLFACMRLQPRYR